MDQYGSDERCEAALIASRWPQGFACPVCGGPSRLYINFFQPSFKLKSKTRDGARA